jgi:hypothetical protein
MLLCNCADFDWTNPQPLDTLLLRLFRKQCSLPSTPSKLGESLDGVMPTISSIVKHIKVFYNDFHTTASPGFSNQSISAQNLLIEKTFTLSQLLLLSLTLDYSDETGCRKMCALVREMIFDRECKLPRVLLSPTMDLFREVVVRAHGERDFVRQVGDGVVELRDEDDPEVQQLSQEFVRLFFSSFLGSNLSHVLIMFLQDESISFNSQASDPFGTPRLRHPANAGSQKKIRTPEEQRIRDDLDMWCLDIFIAMLQRVNCVCLLILPTFLT